MFKSFFFSVVYMLVSWGSKSIPAFISPDSFIKVKKLKVAKTAANTAERKERRIREQRNRKRNEKDRVRGKERNRGKVQTIVRGKFKFVSFNIIKSKYMWNHEYSYNLSAFIFLCGKKCTQLSSLHYTEVPFYIHQCSVLKAYVCKYIIRWCRTLYLIGLNMSAALTL